MVLLNFSSKWMCIKHNRYLVLMFLLYNISLLSLCCCRSTWWRAKMSHWYSLHICLNLESLSRMLVEALAKHHLCRSRTDSKGTLAQTDTEHNVLWNKCNGGICLYVYSDRPQLHFPAFWRMSKRGLLTITCHTLDVFRVLKCSLKHFFSAMEI